MAIKFNDPSNWLDMRIDGVKRGYYVPNYFNGNGICIDIGANVGAFPLVYGNRFSRVYCYEPAISTYEECLKNVNSLKNVTVFNLAVTNTTNDTVKLKSHKSGNVSGNASIIESNAWNVETNYEYVKTISFADVIKNTEIIGNKNYVKIDTEGSEYDMLLNVDLSVIHYLAVEIHLQLGHKKINELLSHLSNFFNIVKQKGGVNFHHEITYINKLL